MDGTVLSRRPEVRLSWLQQGPLDSAVIVVIHGWASNARVWQDVVGHLPNYGFLALELPGFGSDERDERLMTLEHFVAAASEAIVSTKQRNADNKARHFYLMGWSLGGQVAAEIAARIPSSVCALITVGSNPCFVERADWPKAMATTTYSLFCDDFSKAPDKIVRRFQALQASGAAAPRILKASIKQHLPAGCDDADAQYWLAALRWLAVDSRPAYAEFQKPQLHLLAEQDALVPADVPLQQYGEVQILKNASHCMPLECGERLARAVSVFIKTHSEQALDKVKVARSFSNAASNYDTFAEIQKVVAGNVLERAMASGADAGVVLDVGSGTGELAGALAGRGSSPIALDIAEGMLRYTRQKFTAKEGASEIHYLAADAEFLPLATESVDGVVSSLAIQWCANLPLLFAEMFRVLRPGGRVVLATLGPGTLAELKSAWQAVDEAVHINAFASRSQVLCATRASGFELVKFEACLESLAYGSLMPLLQALKGIGAHNSHAQAPTGLMTRSKFQKLQQAYPLSNDKVIATYDTFYIELLKPFNSSS